VRCQPHLNLIFIKRRNQSGKFIFGPAHNGCISEHAGNISGYFLRSSSAQTLVYKSNFIVQVVLLDRISPSFMPVARQHVAAAEVASFGCRFPHPRPHLPRPPPPPPSKVGVAGGNY